MTSSELNSIPETQKELEERPNINRVIQSGKGANFEALRFQDIEREREKEW